MPVRKKKKAGARKKTLSSFELILSGKLDLPLQAHGRLRAGGTCPQCRKGKLEYNGVLALECPQCEFVSSEGGGCT